MIEDIVTFTSGSLHHSPNFEGPPDIVPRMADFRFHLIEEAQIGSEVVGSDEENILSWSSDQKWESGVGKKQSKSPTS